MNKPNREINNTVNYKIRPKTTKSRCFPLYRIILFFIFIALTNVMPAEAKVAGDVTFSWRANPTKDHVIGYRLYYGGYSRLNTNGRPKANFSYDYYIDLADLKRCVPSSNGTDCKMLNRKDVNCENLYGEVPKCTISNMHGPLYFSLTAYNAQTESRFTPEVKRTVNRKGLAAVQNGITKLLLNK